MKLVFLILVASFCSAQSVTNNFILSSAPAAGGDEATSVSDTIAANNRDGQSNDADEELTATPYSTQYLHWGLYDGAERRAGYQFAIPLAQGVVADSAFLYLYDVESGTEDSDDSTFIKIEDSDNAAVFDATHTHSLTAHGGGVWTGGQVVWMTSTWTGPGYNKSPDIASLVNHVLARGGWSSGNYMSLVLDYGTTWTGDQHGTAADFTHVSNPGLEAYIIVCTH